MGTQTIGPITPKAFIGSSSVATLSPNTYTKPGPAIVDIPLLVNPKNNINANNAVFEVENIPMSLIAKSMPTTHNILFPNPNLSPNHPHTNVPTKADTVLATRQYPKK